MMTEFQDIMPYGQLGARLAGLLTYKFWILTPCIYYGWFEMKGKTYYDGGKCAGEFTSLLFDVKF